MDTPEPRPAPIGANLPSRRTIAKGVAWTMPVIAVGAVVPTASASGPPPKYGLDGTFTVSRTCKTLSQTGGTLAVTQTSKGQTIKSICLNISVRADSGSVAGLAWARVAGDDGKWGLPSPIGTSTYAGYTWNQYQSCLSVLPTVTDGSTVVDPKFSFSASTLPKADVYVYVERVVVITLPNSTDTTTVKYIRNIAQPSYDCSGRAGNFSKSKSAEPPSTTSGQAAPTSPSSPASIRPAPVGSVSGQRLAD